MNTRRALAGINAQNSDGASVTTSSRCEELGTSVMAAMLTIWAAASITSEVWCAGLMIFAACVMLAGCVPGVSGRVPGGLSLALMPMMSATSCCTPPMSDGC